MHHSLHCPKLWYDRIQRSNLMHSTVPGRSRFVSIKPAWRVSEGAEIKSACHEFCRRKLLSEISSEYRCFFVDRFITRSITSINASRREMSRDKWWENTRARQRVRLRYRYLSFSPTDQAAGAEKIYCLFQIFITECFCKKQGIFPKVLLFYPLFQEISLCQKKQNLWTFIKTPHPPNCRISLPVVDVLENGGLLSVRALTWCS